MEGLVRMPVDRAERVAIDGMGTVATKARLPATVKLVNLSRTGCLFLVKGAHPPEIGSTLTVGIPGIGTRSAIVVRTGADGIGCTFTDWLQQTEVEAARAARTTKPAATTAAIRSLRRSIADRDAAADEEPQTWRTRFARWRAGGAA